MVGANTELASRVHEIDLLHVPRVAGSVEHPIDVKLVWVLNVVVTLSECDLSLISVHSEDLVLRYVERYKVLNVFSRALMLEVAEPATSWDPRVAVVCPYDHLASWLLTTAVHSSNDSFPYSSGMLLAPVLAYLVDVVRVAVVLHPVQVPS
jgi:hypothetical protein